MLRYLRVANVALFWAGVSLVAGSMVWLWVNSDSPSAETTFAVSEQLKSLMFVAFAVVLGILPYALAAYIAHRNRNSLTMQSVAVVNLTCFLVFQAFVYYFGLIVERDALSGLLLFSVPVYLVGGLMPLYVIFGGHLIWRCRQAT